MKSSNETCRRGNSLLRSRYLGREALRDDPNNGCGGDYRGNSSDFTVHTQKHKKTKELQQHIFEK